MSAEAEPHASPALPVATVARRLGVAPTTLRTWDRRYGLGPTARESGTHRRYSAADIARLEAMRRLVLSGVTPAEAARAALAEQPSAPAASAATTARYAGTGGRVLPMSGAEPRTRGLARAAMSLDADAVTDLLAETLLDDGVVTTWDELLRPLFVAVGERWEHTGEGVEVEHLLSECATNALHRLPRPRPLPGVRPVLLACAPQDHHVLPLLALAAALGERRISTRLLGAATPLDALAAAVRRTGPAAVVLWSQFEETADLAAFDAVPQLRPRTTVIAGGRGWPAELPLPVRYSGSLCEALDLGVAAARG